MELEPGYVTREDMPLLLTFAVEGRFESLFSLLGDPLAGGQDITDQARARLVEATTSSLPDALQVSLGQAEDAHAQGAIDPTPNRGGQLVDAGGSVDGLRGSVLRFLPQPDVPIEGDFINPPDPSTIHTGRGFDSIQAPPETQPPPVTQPTPPASDEQKVRLQIRGLYRELLFREPDPSGWDYYTDQVLSGAMTIADVRATIMASDEYREKHGG